MRFMLTVLLLVAVVMIVADADRGGRRRYRHNRPSLKHVSCHKVKNAGVCERCCDPCKDVKCCEPLTCSGGDCKCNGVVCGDNQECTVQGRGGHGGFGGSDGDSSGGGVLTCVNKQPGMMNIG